MKSLINTLTSVAAVIIFLYLLWVPGSGQADTQIGIINTVAGDGTSGYGGDGSSALQAQLNYPMNVAVDSAGNIYIADYSNNSIRKVDVNGTITTVAGTGESGYSGDGGPATEAQLSYPMSVAADSSGNIYIADNANFRIRKVDAAGTITTAAGTGTYGFSGDGGPATEAALCYPYGITVDSAGSLYITDQDNQRIRKVDANGIITTVAGNGSDDYCGDNAAATAACLSFPSDVAVDSSGNIYIADQNNSRIRKVDANGIITTAAGTGAYGFSGDGGPATEAEFYGPGGVATDNLGNLYIADSGNNRIRKVDTEGVIITVAGTGDTGYSGDGGPATEAKIDYTSDITVDSNGAIYIPDTYNQRIRRVSSTSQWFPPTTTTTVVATTTTTVVATTTTTVVATTTTTTVPVPVDSDEDGILDTIDNCPNAYNTNQFDANSNGIGDCCDPAPGCGGCGQPECDTVCSRPST